MTENAHKLRAFPPIDELLAHTGDMLLLDRILQAAASFGTRSVFLEVRESNVAARKLYESRGFAVAGSRKQYHRKPAEDAIVMRRAL